MLTLIAYRFAIGATLPAISYLTRLDVFILLSTILIYASLIVVLVTTVYTRKDKPAIATRIDEISRWAFPVFYVASWIGSMMIHA
jgi:cadmium resistance protein CadD (predicted permease)